MTTISNNRRRKRLSPAAALIIVILLCCIAAVLLFQNALAGSLWRVLAPVFAGRNVGANAAAGIFGGFGSHVELSAENVRLRAALASSTAAAADRNILYAENLDLKARLGRTTASSSVIAAVLLRPPGVPYDTLVIDAGKNAGIREGNLVSAEGSVFIGKVSQVYDTTSRVILFSAPGQTYQAQLRGSVPLSIAGQGAGSLAGELPTGVPVAVGDPVLLPSISPAYAGRVTAVLHHEGESFQTVFLTLPVNMLSLRFVHVHNAD